ncbi:MAG TPA: aminodeoxychorismate/anthranilate synthase component II [Actinomycetota bacterium]|nr:aminodeoxychorismate/anthranilate synthase component II [Actinomycetota bacterium]
MNVVVCDNYDSFTFNLVQYLGELGASVDVVRNDEVSADDVASRRPGAVVISPGPGRPADAGISIDLVKRCASAGIPLLGVCLGHQAIAEAFGARIVHAPAIMHGKTSAVLHRGEGVLRGVPSPFEAGRYHSLVVDEGSLPSVLEVTARTRDGVVMALRHARLAISGVQFHPESILTDGGLQVLRNFLRIADADLDELSATDRRPGERVLADDAALLSGLELTNDANA